MQMFMIMDYVQGGSVTQKMMGEDTALHALSEDTVRK
jgi:aminoglycoside phosphotransferase (APT) family kinase protein